MKKAILLSLLFVACVFTASAQKFALIDMEYILKNIPAYEQANTQLNQASQHIRKPRLPCRPHRKRKEKKRL